MRDEQYVRKLSLNERLWIAAARAFPPYSNQMILEGEDNSTIDMTKFKNAVTAASAVNPGSRVALKGVLGGCRLVDSGTTPRVREVDGSGWDGMSDKKAPFLAEPLSVDLKEPACEILVIHGKPLRLCFRTHHAVMDARGTGNWAGDIFRLLKGEKPLGSPSTMSDLDLALSYKKRVDGTKPSGGIPPTGAAQNHAKGFVWLRKELTGTFPHLIGQLATLVAREAWSHTKGTVTVGIPVDWRILHNDVRSTANLSVAVGVPINPGTTPRDFTNEMKRRIMERVRGIDSTLNLVLQYTPLWILSGLFEMMTKKMNRAGRYTYSALITGTKGESLEEFSGGGFMSKNIFFVPPYFGIIPFFIAFVDCGRGTQLVATAPRALENSGRFEALMNTIVSGLERSDK